MSRGGSFDRMRRGGYGGGELFLTQYFGMRFDVGTTINM